MNVYPKKAHRCLSNQMSKYIKQLLALCQCEKISSGGRKVYPGASFQGKSLQTPQAAGAQVFRPGNSGQCFTSKQDTESESVGLDRTTFSPSGVFLLCLQLMKSLPYGLSENTRQLGMGHCQRCAFCLIKHSGLTKTVWVPCQVNHRQQGVFSRPCRAALFVLCAVYIPHLFKYIQSGTL